MLEANEELPWDALRYVIGQITYGGRVTDDWDRRTLMAILNNFLIEDALLDNYKFSESGTYASPKIGSLQYYRQEYNKSNKILNYFWWNRDLIDKFPSFESPEVFGMHDNANITF